MPVPQIVLDLVKRFDQNKDSYKSPSYNETQLRLEFLDPFLEAFGWDIYNKQGHAEAYKDVIHEDAIKIGAATKAPDYCFRIGRERKFFVEAKKPSINLKEDSSPAFQLRRYAWSAKLPLSILTDFEEFAIYDCRIKPVKADKPSVGRIHYYTYQDYEKNWDEIASIFSKGSVLNGSFDKYADTGRGKGTATVDSAFLSEIENWRELLAKNIAVRNPKLSQRELNFAVQKTIDRIIFLRICEDRGAELYGALQALLNGENIYRRLIQLFRKADDKYNSGLFHFQQEKGRPETPDEFTLSLHIDDKPLKEILEHLYYPESPYEFSVLSADILGQVYEQFLGKVIRLTKEHHAKIEEKPEVKKAGGVYYTPTYIVDYIVKNTVGKLVEGKDSKDVAKLRILDPACGSGSFLLGAYQFLLDWHRDFYVNDGIQKWMTGKAPAIYEASKGDWKLTTQERKRILLNNIYGVDIDTQAVEVTKLSLLLKVLEGENSQTISLQQKLFHERALPDLGNNIKCGNSLIGSDYFAGQSLNLFGDEDRTRVNAFDWDGKDGFAEIMKAGGFDAVIGNPPYVRQETLGDEFKKYAVDHYKTYTGTADLYVYFFERSHRLLRVNGLFGMICSNKFMRANYGKPLRDFLSNETGLIQIVDFGELPVFENAATFPAIYLTSNQKIKNHKFIYGAIKRLDFQSLEKEVEAIGSKLDNRSLKGDNWTLASSDEVNLIDKINKLGVPLGEYAKAEIYRGVLTGLNDAFVINDETRKKLIKDNPNSKEIIKPFVVGDDVRKYHVNFQNRFLIFAHHGIEIQKYSAIFKHLLPFKERLMPKPGDWKGGEWKGRKQGRYEWYEIQDTVEYCKQFEQPKIIYPVIAKEPRFTLEESGAYSNDKTFIIPSKDYYLLGILNSRLVWMFLKRLCSVLGDPDKGGRLELRGIHLCQLPIMIIDIKEAKEKARYDQMVDLVIKMLDLNKKLTTANTNHDKTLIQRQIDATDKEIDALVYELYGLTEEEIRIVEGS